MSKDNKFVTSEVGVFGHGFDLSSLLITRDMLKRERRSQEHWDQMEMDTVQKWSKDGLYEVRVFNEELKTTLENRKTRHLALMRSWERGGETQEKA